MFRRDTTAEAAFRQEVRAWIEGKLPLSLRGHTVRPPPAELMPWYRKLSERGWIAPHWPKAHGGMGASIASLAGYTLGGVCIAFIFCRALDIRMRELLPGRAEISAARGLVRATQDEFSRTSGAAIDGRFGAVGAMKEALLAGTPCDVMVTTAAMVAALQASRELQAGTQIDLGRVYTGIAVRAADPRPDVSRPEALRAALPHVARGFVD